VVEGVEDAKHAVARRRAWFETKKGRDKSRP
jgi:hypothetical protein